jgi:hypothetical protein
MSGENFRDYWPQACMASLMGRSLDLMDRLATDHDNSLRMRHFGYDFVSQSAECEIFPSEHLRKAAGDRQINRTTGALRYKERTLTWTRQIP